MPEDNLRVTRPAIEFWLLGGLLILVFLTGGSSRADVQSLHILRPIAIVLAGYSLFTLRLEHLRAYRHLCLLLALIVALPLAHLIPLPPETWHKLPGRMILQQIDDALGIRDQWRPLSMVPAATLNALYALSIPIAIFGLAIRLSADDHARVLVLIIALTIASGAIGVLQAIGTNINFYAQSSESAGVFANRNHQGVLLAILFPMLAVAARLGEAISLQRRLAVLLAVALAIVAVPLIIINGSRAGLIASLIAMLVVPIVGLRGPEARPQGSLWYNVAKVGLVATVVGALVWLTIFASRQTALTRLENSEDDLRYPVWASIIDVLHGYMPWGTGIGTYADAYQILEPEALLRPTFSNHAHNEWLEIAFTAGLPGIAITALVVLLYGCAAWKALRASGPAGIFSRLGLAIIAILAFASTFDYPVRTPIMSSVLVIAAVWASSFSSFGITNGRR